MSKYNFDEFLTMAHKKWGTKFNYIRDSFINQNEPMRIICPKHGEFKQSPYLHLISKHGCKKCAYDEIRRGKIQCLIKKAIAVHSGKYEYKLESIDDKLKIDIICPKHGIFRQSLRNHVYCKHGCPKCAIDRISKTGRSNTEDFIRKANKIHNGFYSYDKVEYISATKKVTITCPIHGDFEQQPNNHLTGYGCSKCGDERCKRKNSLSTKEFIDRSNIIHNNKYDYKNVDYKNNSTKIKIICPIHGEFEQLPHNHLQGKGCPKCQADSISDRCKMSKDDFIEKARIIHGDRYIYDKTIIDGTHKKSIITCPIHGDFEQNLHNHLCGNGCPSCVGHGTSKIENEIFKFVSKLDESCKNRCKIDGIEIDIFVKNKNIGFEFDGLYWHNSEFKDKNAHIDKTKKLAIKGIRLIHIFEDEWVYKKEIVKSRIKNILNLTDERIYARKTTIKEISSKDAKIFFENNHLQGYCNSSIRVGLFIGDELVSSMSFSKPRLNVRTKKEDGLYEMTRFANKIDTSVIGGAGKMMSYFINKYKPKKIISYADARWSNGNVYKSIGFEEIHLSPPSYFYVKGQKRYNRFIFRKDVLIKNGADKYKTEKEIMEDLGYSRIYDCGSYKFMKICSN